MYYLLLLVQEILMIFQGVNILRIEWSETLATHAMQAKSEGSPFLFCFLSKFKIFSTVSTILFEFLFLGTFFILISFL